MQDAAPSTYPHKLQQTGNMSDNYSTKANAGSTKPASHAGSSVSSSKPRCSGTTAGIGSNRSVEDKAAALDIALFGVGSQFWDKTARHGGYDPEAVDDVVDDIELAGVLD